MKLLHSLRPLSAALFLLTACAFHGEDREAARKSLELAVSLEQAGIDTTDVSILQPARDYYPQKGNTRERMLLWYHLGRIEFNRGEYGEASVSFRKAAGESVAAGDPRCEGMAYRGLADVYNRTWNAREDSLYLLRACDAFLRARDSLSLTETRIRLAGAFYNDCQWDKALRQYEQALQTGHPLLRRRCLSHFGSFLLDAPEGSPVRALACLDEARSAGEPFPRRRWCDYAYALYLNGRKGEADRIWSELERRCPDGFPPLDYRLYCRYRKEGNQERAFHYLERGARAQDSLWRTQASEAVSGAQRDYMESVARQRQLEAEREKERRREAVAGGILLAALVALGATMLVREERVRRLTVQQALSDSERLVARLEAAEQAHLNKIHSLNRDVRVARATLEEVRADYLFLFRGRYKQLGNLFEVRSTTGSDRAVCQRVGEILKEIDGDRKGFRQLRGFIEEKLDRPISHLLSDIPDLKEDDIRLFCYLVIGYEPSLISLLTGIENLNTVYTRKHRLLERIRKLPASKARRYLDLVD